MSTTRSGPDGRTRQRRRSLIAVLTLIAVLGGGLAGAAGSAAPASAATPPAAQATAAPLPTAQVNGVVWSQAIVGDTVYVAGDFTSARPAGSPAGTNEVPRSYVLAYRLSTGELLPGFAPVLNAQARAITASPDGSRIYVGGAFTTVNGRPAYRIAALDPVTGAALPGFAPVPNSRVNVIVATGNTVYFGGWFGQVGSTVRNKAAAVDATTGALLPWVPSVENGDVSALVVSPDGNRAVLGGNFTTLNGSANPGYGMGAVDTATGANLPWAVNALLRDAGTNSGVTSLSTDGTDVYGTGYSYSKGGNFEGTFRARWDDGSLTWLEDCHGDTYSAYPSTDAVYVVGHAHYCGNVGGFPQTEPWAFHRALAFSKETTGTLSREYLGYTNYEGKPAPSLLSWYPELEPGTFTGQTQAAWSVTGNADWVVLGGEFPTVNGQPQQGLVRFAKRSVATASAAPINGGALSTPTLRSIDPGTVRVSWISNWDRDDATLTYRLVRDGRESSPIQTVTGDSSFWRRPAMTFQDTGLDPGSVHTYRLIASDSSGNVVKSDNVGVTVATAADPGYAAAVLRDAPTNFWRLGETGTTGADVAGFNDLTMRSGATRSAAGALPDGDPATTFNGTSSGNAYSRFQIPSPISFAVETWVRTTSTAGGKIVGFGNRDAAASGTYDRHLYVDTAGRVNFGVYAGTSRYVLSSRAAINNGQWHHVVGNFSPAGMELIVDGARQGTRADVTVANPYLGYWKVGGDASWAGSGYLNGTIDDTAVYAGPLSLNAVDRHLRAAGRTSVLATAPADEYGAAVFRENPQLYWRLADTTGTTAADSSTGNNDGVYTATGVTRGRTGALDGVANTAVALDGTSGAVASSQKFVNPQVYSTEAWFRTTSTAGGKIIGFASAQTGTTGSYDRHVYLQRNGTLVFGATSGSQRTITTTGVYNDGQWHHVAATQGGDGMKLYVDGALAGTNAATTAGVYDGYWRVGSGAGWSTINPFLAGTVDEVAVYGAVLTPDTVASHWKLGRGVNDPPTAAFTSTARDLTVGLDGTGSTDPDGTVTAWSWDFGDGSTGTGATVNHTWATAGTWTVTLTVTDDRGATARVSHDVQTTEPANQPPTAAFTAAPTGLTVAVDGTGSSDPDGTVTAWSWDFGDGSTGTGATAGHTYATAGTWTVTLTVTDSRGATATTTRAVTVIDPSAPVVVAKDAFTRTVASGLGTADVGGKWTMTSTTAATSVDGSAAQAVFSAVRTSSAATLTGVSSSATDTTVSVGTDRVIDGGGLYLSVIGRKALKNSYYANVLFKSTGGVSATIVKSVSGVDTTVAGGPVTGLTYGPGTTLRVRLVVAGTGTTALKLKVWDAASPEPDTWLVDTTDATAELQTSGQVGYSTYLSGSTTTLPATLRLDDLLVTEAR
ncbi:LamG-like jellyroll fold domain-containing protein [Tersicoccus sp. Bi-70]|uniref:LamG-like jellyroll fold domain-containing protein n=1 Tax=Tersicoccus sp. Bi-70 TaxID=1897634 RepID=UPI000975ED08|nr:LamG-like jellyroll fold domain-containing protein [Tersicoccus sp. Bi-70]OMH31374.1 hypothetical protein BGP79_10190 [Tersicoccus sp. Bi-70]